MIDVLNRVKNYVKNCVDKLRYPQRDDNVMDMAVADLFKHKIRFELVSEDSDYEENRFYSKGLQYTSKRIENLESIDVRNWVDQCLHRLQSFFVHVLSTMVHEIEVPVDHMEIKSRIRQAEDNYGGHDLVGFTMDNSANNITIFDRCSTVHIYGFDDEWFNKPFYIDVEAYFYISQSVFTPLAPWILAGLNLEIM